MKKHEFETAAITAGGKRIGTLIVSAELADDIRFNPNFPTESELRDDGSEDELVKNGF